MNRVFLLSPAHAGGRRAAMLFRTGAGFPLAQALQRGEARSLGEIFQFLSGLYFRGKLAYAARFGRPPPRVFGGYVITSHRGLVPMNGPTTLADLKAFANVPIDAAESRYVDPLRQSARVLAAAPDCEFVLLGSISTTKYAEPLLDILGDRLLFPADFLGRGDMSRGGLLLRAVRDEDELVYQRMAGAVRRGVRPPRLQPASWRGTPWEARQ